MTDPTIRRYMLVSDYSNNQTDLEWQRLLERIAVTEPTLLLQAVVTKHGLRGTMNELADAVEGMESVPYLPVGEKIHPADVKTALNNIRADLF